MKCLDVGEKEWKPCRSHVINDELRLPASGGTNETGERGAVYLRAENVSNRFLVYAQGL